MADTTVLGVNLVNLLVFILVLFTTILVARITYSILRKALDLRLGKRKSKITSNFVQYVILTLGIGYGVLGVLRLDLTAMVASLGLVGIAVAFSSQQLIQNFIAGVMIALDRRVRMEDWIEINGNPSNDPSRVVDITLTRTILRDINGRMTIVPNSLMITNQVVNYTKSGFLEVVVPFPLPVGADRDKVVGIIMQVLAEHPLVLPNVQGTELKATERDLRIPQLRRFLEDRTEMTEFMPRVLVQEVSNLRVNMGIRFWIREVQNRDVVVSELLSKIIDRLGREGMTVP
ncbi:MAG: mechanosensitive ion channel family protein [Euryarchaeota archaeon]|nr:mechanosensitive ion channel family protein [Euryarchaeota archaeon]